MRILWPAPHIWLMACILCKFVPLKHLQEWMATIMNIHLSKTPKRVNGSPQAVWRECCFDQTSHYLRRTHLFLLSFLHWTGYSEMPRPSWSLTRSTCLIQTVRFCSLLTLGVNEGSYFMLGVSTTSGLHKGVGPKEQFTGHTYLGGSKCSQKLLN